MIEVQIMARPISRNIIQTLIFSLLAGVFTLGIAGCGAGYEGEVGEEGEREETVGEQGIGEREEAEEDD
ncbi:hypothetical protein ACQ4M4_14750 [Leptolyngbya sp. AN02str]|uniref:hypothetical protein n=1 Tax=Leptolyngbya sp. AN02str TaxID=3423363 RepID=UPI003D312851